MAEETEELTLSDLLEKYMDQEKMYHLSGRKGVENLARVARVLGYKDPQYFGQFQGGAFGDLIDFFEDNPGALEAVVDWISEQDLPEWREKVASELEEQNG